MKYQVKLEVDLEDYINPYDDLQSQVYAWVTLDTNDLTFCAVTIQDTQRNIDISYWYDDGTFHYETFELVYYVGEPLPQKKNFEKAFNAFMRAWAKSEHTEDEIDELVYEWLT